MPVGLRPDNANAHQGTARRDAAPPEHTRGAPHNGIIVH